MIEKTESQWVSENKHVSPSQKGWPRGKDANGIDTYGEDQVYVWASSWTDSQSRSGYRHSNVPDTVADDIMSKAWGDYADRFNDPDELMFN